MLAPKAKADKVLFPKLFQGEFGAEISTLLTSKSQALHSSFWDGDQESFIIQSGARGLSQAHAVSSAPPSSPRSGGCATRCRTARSSAPAARMARSRRTTR